MDDDKSENLQNIENNLYNILDDFGDIDEDDEVYFQSEKD